MKTILQNALLILFSVAACLGLAEVAVRLAIAPPELPDAAAAAQGVQKIVAFDDRLESRYRPNSRAVIRSPYGEFETQYEINELGLRDRPLPAAPGQAYRILVLGNSLAEGWGVPAEKGFVQLAERRLAANRTGKPAVRLINAGISGYGAAQSYLLFQELREKVRPDAIVFIYVSTMVHFDYKYLAQAEFDASQLATGLSVDAVLKGGVPQTGRPADDTEVSPRLRRIAEWSALLRLAVLSRMARVERARITAGDPATDLLAGLRGDPVLLPKMHEPSFRHVAAIAALAARNGVPFILIHLPLPHQLSAREWDKGRVAYGLEEKIYSAPDRLVVEVLCQRAKIACIAAHEALGRLTAQSASAKRLFYRYDFHPNEEGNAALGVWLADQLAKLPLP